MEHLTWYQVDNIHELDSPALLIYPDRVKQNIKMAIEMVGGDVSRLRPHVKTNKSPDATNLMLGAGITKFKCATIAEAEMLGICGAPDVLLAYQPIGPKLARLVNLVRKYPSTRYSCLMDNVEAAAQMSSVFSAAGLTVPVYIDLNLGQNRTGIAPLNPAIDLFVAASAFRGITLAGLHAYDGHIRAADFILREQQCDEAFAWVEKTATAIQQNTSVIPVIIAGGTPSFAIHSKRQHCECSPGTIIYWDKGYLDLCPEQPFLAAALVMTRVISVPAENLLCLDLGHKSVGAENELARRVYFLNAPDLKPIAQSEEHLVMQTPPKHSYKIGDVLYGMPVHICPTVALYERACTVSNHQLNGYWKNSARDRTISI